MTAGPCVSLPRKRGHAGNHAARRSEAEPRWKARGEKRLPVGSLSAPCRLRGKLTAVWSTGAGAAGGAALELGTWRGYCRSGEFSRGYGVHFSRLGHAAQARPGPTPSGHLRRGLRPHLSTPGMAVALGVKVGVARTRT